MKKILFILIISTLFLSLSAQNNRVTLTGASTGVVIDLYGTTSDTLTASATKNYVVFVAAPFLFDIFAEVRSVKVSGSPAYTATFTESIDGTNYVAVANCANSVQSAGTNYDLKWKTSGVAALAADTTVLTGRYLKIAVTATGATQKSKLSGKIKIVQKYPF